MRFTLSVFLALVLLLSPAPPDVYFVIGDIDPAKQVEIYAWDCAELRIVQGGIIIFEYTKNNQP